MRLAGLSFTRDSTKVVHMQREASATLCALCDSLACFRGSNYWIETPSPAWQLLTEMVICQNLSKLQNDWLLP